MEITRLGSARRGKARLGEARLGKARQGMGFIILTEDFERKQHQDTAASSLNQRHHASQPAGSTIRLDGKRYESGYY